MLIKFTIKISLIIFDLLIFGGLFLFCIFFVINYDYYFLSKFLGILIPITFVTKLIYLLKFKDIKNDLTKTLIAEQFVAIILMYIVPIYILWKSSTLYVNKEILNVIYVFMVVFFITGISIEKKLFFTKKRM